jgi:hypothetical protein
MEFLYKLNNYEIPKDFSSSSQSCNGIKILFGIRNYPKLLETETSLSDGKFTVANVRYRNHSNNRKIQYDFMST